MTVVIEASIQPETPGTCRVFRVRVLRVPFGCGHMLNVVGCRGLGEARRGDLWPM